MIRMIENDIPATPSIDEVLESIRVVVEAEEKIRKNHCCV